jgi:hypothetical protein
MSDFSASLKDSFPGYTIETNLGASSIPRGERTQSMFDKINVNPMEVVNIAINRTISRSCCIVNTPSQRELVSFHELGEKAL